MGAQVTTIQFCCSMCPAVHASFSDALGHFLEYIDRGERVTDWVEVSEEMIKEKNA